jgi:hypothetical protein
MDKLSPEERTDYQAMLDKQRRKPVLKNKPLVPEMISDTDIVTEAYIHYLCLQRGVALKESVSIPNEIKEKIYKLYLDGVLPVRIGGVNAKRNE